MKTLSNKRSVKLAVVKDESGKVITEGTDIKERWKRYCEGLFASQEVVVANHEDSASEEEPCRHTPIGSPKRNPET